MCGSRRHEAKNTMIQIIQNLRKVSVEFTIERVRNGVVLGSMEGGIVVVLML